MKRIIGGKVYNTETAKFLGERSYSYPGQFNYVSEELYRKKTGEYFLYGEGGPMTKYAEDNGLGSRGSGSDIRPLKPTEAQEWAEKYLDADEVMELFGISEEDEQPGAMVVSLNLSSEAIARLRKASERSSKSMSKLASEAICQVIPAE